MPKPVPDKEYRAWIRKHPCVICGSGDWDFDIGEWTNSVSHIRSKGSGGKDEGNVLPMCLGRQCHHQFENYSKLEKSRFIRLAQTFWKEFLAK